MKECKRFATFLLSVLGKLIASMLKIVVRSIVFFDRKIVKRYTGIETPAYKLWWHFHKSQMQDKLNRQTNKYTF